MFSKMSGLGIIATTKMNVSEDITETVHLNCMSLSCFMKNNLVCDIKFHPNSGRANNCYICCKLSSFTEISTRSFKTSDCFSFVGKDDT